MSNGAAWIAGILVGASLMAIAISNSEFNFSTPNEIGTEWGACYGNNTCNEELICFKNVCISKEIKR